MARGKLRLEQLDELDPDADIIDEDSGRTYKAKDILTSRHWTTAKLWERIRANTAPEFQRNVDTAFTIIYGGDILRLQKLKRVKFLRKVDLRELAEDLKQRGVIQENAELSYQKDPDVPLFEDAVNIHRREQRKEAFRKIREDNDKRLGVVREKEGFKGAHVFKLKCIVAKYGFDVISLLNSLEPVNVFDKKLEGTLERLVDRYEGRAEPAEGGSRGTGEREEQMSGIAKSPSQCEICSQDTSLYSITWREMLADGGFGSRSLKTGKDCGSSLFSLFDIDSFREKLRKAQVKEADFEKDFDLAFTAWEREEPGEEAAEKLARDRQLELEEEYRQELLERLEEADRIRQEVGDASEMLRAMQVRASYLGFFREEVVAGNLPERETAILLRMLRRPAEVTDSERLIMKDYYNRECYFKKSETIAPIIEDIEYLVEQGRLRIDNPRYIRARTRGLLDPKRDSLNTYETDQVLAIVPNLMSVRKREHNEILREHRRRSMEDAISALFDLLEKARMIEDQEFRTLRGSTRHVGSDFWTVNRFYDRWMVGKAIVNQSKSQRLEHLMNNISTIESIRSFEEKYRLLMPIHIKAKFKEYEDKDFEDFNEQFVLFEDVEKDPERYFGIRGVSAREIVNTVMYSLNTTNSVYRRFVETHVKRTGSRVGIEKLLRKGIISQRYLGKDGQIAKWYRSLRKKKVEKADKDLTDKIKDIHQVLKLPYVVNIHPFEAYSKDLGKVRYVSSSDAAMIRKTHKELNRLMSRFRGAKSRSVTNAIRKLEKYKGHYVLEEDFLVDLRIREYKGPRTDKTRSRTKKDPYIEYYDPEKIKQEKQKLERCVKVEGSWLDKLEAVLARKAKEHLGISWHKPYNLSSIREEEMPEHIFVDRDLKKQVDTFYKKLDDIQLIDIDEDFIRRYEDLRRLSINYPMLNEVWTPSSLEDAAYNAFKQARAGRKLSPETVSLVESFDPAQSATSLLLDHEDPRIAAVVRKERKTFASNILKRVYKRIRGMKDIWEVIHGTVEGLRYGKRKRRYEARLAGDGRYDLLHFQDFTKGLREIAEPRGEIGRTEFRVSEYVLRNLFVDRLEWQGEKVNITPISVVDRLGIENVDRPVSEVPERKAFLEEIAKGLLEGKQYSVYLEDHDVGRFYKVQASQGERGVIKVTGLYGNLGEQRKLSLKYKGPDYLEAARKFIDTALERFRPRGSSARHYVENFRDDFDLRRIPEFATIQKFESIVNQELQRGYTLRKLIA